MTNIISRKDALARGLIKYFTGQPCSRGHISERWVKAYNCIECQSYAGKKYREDNRQELNKRARDWRAANPEKSRDATLRKRRGISVADYKEMAENQNNKCAICFSDNPATRHGFFEVDHCHKTNKIRGLLCRPCNLMLGSAKDNPAILRSAIDYLRKHPGFICIKEAA